MFQTHPDPGLYVGVLVGSSSWGICLWFWVSEKSSYNNNDNHDDNTGFVQIWCRNIMYLHGIILR